MTFDERHIAKLLVRITDSMGRPALGDLVDECNAAILACLASTRKEEEPKAPTTDELVQLADRVVRVGPHERKMVLREIRNALGRLDMHHRAV
jgi:hypothetical protein